MKKIRTILLMALAALMCFAAAACAAKSVQVIDHDVDSKGPNYTQFAETNNWDIYVSDGDIDTGAFTVANVPTTELLEQFVPASYKGNVSADCYYRIQLAQKGLITVPAMSASDYQIWSGINVSLTTEITAFMKAISDDAEMFILVPATGEPVSVDKVMVNNDMDSGIVPQFTTTTPLALPVSIYAVKFTDNPIPIVKHIVTATAGANGTITPASADVEEGASKDFTVTADRGYMIDALTVDGAAVAAAAGQPAYTYTLESASKDLTITASFKTATGQENVSGVELAGDGVTLAKDPVFVTGSDELVSSFDLYTGGSAELSFINEDGTAGDAVTFKKDEGGFVCAMTLDVAHPNNDGAAATFLLSPSGTPFDTAKKYYAVIQKKDKSGYSIFACKHAADGLLGVTVKPVGDYFTENTVAVYTGTVASAAGGDTPAGGGSGGGCSTGIAAFALLALVPLALRRKR